MIETKLNLKDVTDENVLKAMKKVLRQEFVPENLKDNAYDDCPLPIGYGQTISQPYITALMTENLELKKDYKVLEIGTGSGYQAAILAKLVDKVYTIEIIKELADSAKKRLNRLEYKNIEVKHADGYYGWKEKAPYDAIILTAAAETIPPPLLKQLKDNGRLIMPLGNPTGYQLLIMVTKSGRDTETKFITGVKFVPLTGKALE
ncbi:MAG: protein-L-isoaspartate(D-aspartate) O-methyltransferase [archaeon]